MMNKINLLKSTVAKTLRRTAFAVGNNRGDFYISDAVRIIAAVVLGALLLAALVLIFNTTVIPKVTQAITDLFN